MNKPLNADKKQRAYILYIMEAGAKKPGNISISIFCQHKSTNRNNPYKNIPTKKKSNKLQSQVPKALKTVWRHNCEFGPFSFEGVPCVTVKMSFNSNR